MAWRESLARWMPPAVSQRFNLGQYPQFLNDYYQQFGYAGSLYPLGANQSFLSWSKTEEISGTLPNYMTALRRSPPAFAAQMVRALTLSMARFTFRSRPNSSTPRRTFGTQDLRILEQPWTNGTTGELISRMEWSAGLAGNAYILRQNAGTLKVLRPDWVAIIYGSNSQPDDPKGALDGQVLGYLYQNGGFSSQNRQEMQTLLPEQVAHWSPLVDPMSPGLGMSWITPALRDIQADQSALEYKLAFFSNGATPNLVIKGVPGTSPAQFQEWIKEFGGRHDSTVNAFKTIYLSGGADATVIGSNLQQLDLESVTGHGEVRISFLSRVPAVLLGIAAGLKGSSLNAGNYAEARRNFADTWAYPALADLCGALSPLISVPGGAELWFDPTDIPLFREDAKDAAAIFQIKISTVVSAINGGFDPDTVIQAVNGQDLTQLKHTGLVSVQLQPPGTTIKQAEALEAAPVPAQLPAASNQNGNGNGAAASKEIQPAARSQWQRVEQPPSPVTVVLPEGMVHVNVEAARAPEVNVPVTVMPAEVKVQQPIAVKPPNVVVNVEQPQSQGVEVEYDAAGRVAGVRPKRSRR